jgi:hypothetical protein
MRDECQHKVGMTDGRWFCGKPGPCWWPRCEPEWIKEFLAKVEWTEDSIKAEFRKVLEETKVTEDAGVIVPQFIIAYRTPDAIKAWTQVQVTSLAESVYGPRMDAAMRILALKFHVEHTKHEGDRDEITTHRLAITHEHARPV